MAEKRLQVGPVHTGSEDIETSANKILDYLTPCLGDDEYMVGGAFSIADIAITAPFVNFAIAGEKVDASRWPEIAAYVERIHALPCYAPIVAGDMPGQ